MVGGWGLGGGGGGWTGVVTPPLRQDLEKSRVTRGRIGLLLVRREDSRSDAGQRFL